MKIGILTQPLRGNYGGLLQAFALQKVLKDKGCEVKTEAVPLPSKYKQNFIWGIISFLMRRRSFRAILMPSFIDERKIFCNTRNFVNTYIESERVIDTDDLNSCDAVIVGSDQVWRPMYSPNLSKYFLLDVDDKVKKISYAASFGVDFWEFTKKQEDFAKKGLSRFDAVSVREDSGVSLCREYLNKEAEHVLDPTLLLTKENYCELLHDTKKFSGLYTYILDRNSFKESIISKVSKQLNIKEYTVKPKKEFKDLSLFKKMFSIVDEVVIPPVEEWIMGFRDADFVITDSFHGTLFSIIFKKQFLVIGNKSRGLSRFISILKLFNLENRLIVDEVVDIENMISHEINYSMVNDILFKAREKSVLFMERNISE